MNTIKISVYLIFSCFLCGLVSCHKAGFQTRKYFHYHIKSETVTRNLQKESSSLLIPVTTKSGEIFTETKLAVFTQTTSEHAHTQQFSNDKKTPSRIFHFSSSQLTHVVHQTAKKVFGKRPALFMQKKKDPETSGKSKNSHTWIKILIPALFLILLAIWKGVNLAAQIASLVITLKIVLYILAAATVFIIVYSICEYLYKT